MIDQGRVEVFADLPEGELRFYYHESYTDEEATILMANYLAWEFMRVEPLRHIKVSCRPTTRTTRPRRP